MRAFKRAVLWLDKAFEMLVAYGAVWKDIVMCVRTVLWPSNAIFTR